jgi:type I restriction enzyme S subunit
MSRLEQLIAELCPDGVEYKKLGDVAEYASYRIDASEVNELNYIGVDNLLPEKQGKQASSYVPEEGRLIQLSPSINPCYWEPRTQK